MNQKTQESVGRFQIIQKKWFIMIVLASRIALIQKTVTVTSLIFTVKEARKIKETQIKRRHAAILIQRFYRQYRNRKRFILMQQSFTIIRPYNLFFYI